MAKNKPSTLSTDAEPIAGYSQALGAITEKEARLIETMRAMTPEVRAAFKKWTYLYVDCQQAFDELRDLQEARLAKSL